MIDSSLLQDFITETTEHLEELEDNLLHLEKSPDNFELINGIFRNVHTIKGSAEYLGMQKIANLAHNLESLMDRIRNGDLGINREIIDSLISAGDVISRLVDDLVNEQEEQTSIDGPLEQIVRFLENGGSGESKPVMEKETDSSLPNKDEEYDEELYVIFVQSLREGLTEFIQAISKLVSDGNPATTLDECLALIGSLASSAHYMGYDQLSSLYAGLTAGVKVLQESSSELANPANGQAVEEIESRITEICNLFDINRPDLGMPKIVFEENTSSRNVFPIDFLDEEALQVEIDGAFLEENPLKEEEKTDEFIPNPLNETEHPSGETDTCYTYEEEYDSELFDIFIQQLEEDFEWYKTDVEMLVAAADPGETPEETIDRWKNKLESLQSNANYMGYEELTSIYNDWEKRLEAIVDDLTQEKEIDWQKQLLNSTLHALESTSALFPRAGRLKEISIRAEPILPEIEAAFSDTEVGDEFQLAPDHASLLSDALRDKISKMPVHAETPHEVVSDYLFTDETAFEPIIPVYNKPIKGTVPEGKEYLATEDTQPTGNALVAAGEKTGIDSHDPENSISGSGTDVSQRSDEKNSEAKPIGDVGEGSNPVEDETAIFSNRIRSKSIRVDADKIDALMNQVGELVVSRAWFSQLHHEMRDMKQRLCQEQNIDKRLSKQINQMTFRLHEATSSLGRAANELQEGVMRIRMLPVARLFNRYPRLIHDLVKDGDKKVDLEIRGEDTELDKMVIEKISDPMIHIIRNAIDHGVEKSAERKQAGKPETAKLTINAYHESNHVVIEVTDDGRGIDPRKIKEKVLEQNIMEAVEFERLMDREVLSLITKPGFSTAKKITHTSGRGVGMDVVKKNIEKLNGTVEIDSIIGKETRIRIKIPLTLAIIPALLVRVETELFTIPLSTVEETIKVYTKDIESIEGNEVICLRNHTIPLIRLNRAFNMSATNADSETVFIVIVSNGMNQMGLVVDSMLGQEEVVIKPLEDYLQESSGFSGATILGDGQISLILDIYDLLNLSIAKMEHRRTANSVAMA